ncbi:uncharacterized protein ATC70_007561 [Mucor velutinosus]|uniref:Reverse transcriptase zinc-binding domain-containing protein n=1 Tax=Mucor velutinosus TaxID=708070 RepID=A0AAN7HW03_9FUNG|nr:hypothetical protein ATC70_007561 [Mucor velutinosus]
MPSTARNLWFRLIHNKVSSKANLYTPLRLPDDLCEYSGHRETTAQMLFTCQSNLEILSNYFALVFLPLGALDMSEVYQNVMSLNLSSFHFLDSPLKVSVFVAITCVLTTIWRAKWPAYYDNVGIDNQSIVDRAISNLRNLSSLNWIN